HTDRSPSTAPSSRGSYRRQPSAKRADAFKNTSTTPTERSDRPPTAPQSPTRTPPLAGFGHSQERQPARRCLGRPLVIRPCVHGVRPSLSEERVLPTVIAYTVGVSRIQYTIRGV